MTEDDDSLDDLPYTHRVIMSLSSNGQDDGVDVKVLWSPPMDATDVIALGYLPSAYKVLEKYLLPALEQAELEWLAPDLYSMPSPSQTRN